MCVCVFECVCDVYHCGFHSPAPKAHTCTPYSATEVLYVCTPYRTGCPLSKDQSKEVYGPLLTQLPQHTYVSLFHQRAVFCMSRRHIYVDLQQYAYLPTYNNMLQIFDVTHCTSS